MRVLTVSLLMLAACTSPKLVVPKGELTFGDIATVVSGPYAGCSAQIFNQIADAYKKPCKTHQYYAAVTKNNLVRYDYVCHEDLRVEQ